jgi:hypothetical protein
MRKIIKGRGFGVAGDGGKSTSQYLLQGLDGSFVCSWPMAVISMTGFPTQAFLCSRTNAYNAPYLVLLHYS